MTENKDFTKFAKSNGINSSVFTDYRKKLNTVLGYVSPVITEERNSNVAQMDVFSRLMMDRILFLGDEINDDMSNIIVAQLLFLTQTDPSKDIKIYLNSPGGSVASGLAMIDTMNFIPNDIVTVNTGTCASMAAVLLASGEKGKRFSLKHSRTMIHQPSGGAYGKSSDMEITMKEMMKYKKDLNDILVSCTGQSYENIENDTIMDKWFRPEEAIKYGLIDCVL